MAEAVREEYETSLADLTFNSKPHINMLTMLAEDSAQYAEDIVKVIETYLQKVQPTLRLTYLYLIDSIIKNVKDSNYLNLFQQNIVSNFVSVFEKVNEETRQAMYKLRQTWAGIFSNKKLYAIDFRVNQIDPAWPITAEPPTQTSIHVNPKFITKDDSKALSHGTAPHGNIETNMTTFGQNEVIQMPPRDVQPSFSPCTTPSESPSPSPPPLELEDPVALKEQLRKKQAELLKIQQLKLEMELAATQEKLAQQAKVFKEKEQRLTEKLLMKQQETAQKVIRPAVKAASAVHLPNTDPRLRGSRIRDPRIARPAEAVVAPFRPEVITVPNEPSSKKNEALTKKEEQAVKKDSPKTKLVKKTELLKEFLKSGKKPAGNTETQAVAEKQKSPSKLELQKKHKKQAEEEMEVIPGLDFGKGKKCAVSDKQRRDVSKPLETKPSKSLKLETRKRQAANQEAGEKPSIEKQVERKRGTPPKPAQHAPSKNRTHSTVKNTVALKQSHKADAQQKPNSEFRTTKCRPSKDDARRRNYRSNRGRKSESPEPEVVLQKPGMDRTSSHLQSPHSSSADNRSGEDENKGYSKSSSKQRLSDKSEKFDNTMELLSTEAEAISDSSLISSDEDENEPPPKRIKGILKDTTAANKERQFFSREDQDYRKGEKKRAGYFSRKDSPLRSDSPLRRVSPLRSPLQKGWATYKYDKAKSAIKQYKIPMKKRDADSSGEEDSRDIDYRVAHRLGERGPWKRQDYKVEQNRKEIERRRVMERREQIVREKQMLERSAGWEKSSWNAGRRAGHYGMRAEPPESNIAKVLQPDQQDQIKLQAAQQLRSGKLTLDQYTDLMKQLDQLYKLQLLHGPLHVAGAIANYSSLSAPDVIEHDHKQERRCALLPLPDLDERQSDSFKPFEKDARPVESAKPRPSLLPHPTPADFRPRFDNRKQHANPPGVAFNGPVPHDSRPRFDGSDMIPSQQFPTNFQESRQFDQRPRPGMPPRINDSRELFLDNQLRDIILFDILAVVVINGVPKEVRFEGIPRPVFIDGNPYEMKFGAVRDVFLDGTRHQLRFGAPTREVLIDGYPFQLSFGGPPVRATINGYEHELRVAGPQPEIIIGCDRLDLKNIVDEHLFNKKGGGLSDGGPSGVNAGNFVTPVPSLPGQISVDNGPRPIPDTGFARQRAPLLMPPTNLPHQSPQQDFASSFQDTDLRELQRRPDSTAFPKFESPASPTPQTEDKDERTSSASVKEISVGEDDDTASQKSAPKLDSTDPNAPAFTTPSSSDLSAPVLPVDVSSLLKKLLAAGILPKSEATSETSAVETTSSVTVTTESPAVETVAKTTEATTTVSSSDSSAPKFKPSFETQRALDLLGLVSNIKPSKPMEKITTVPAIPWDATKLKQFYVGVVEMLYTGTQCSSCGMRFRADQQAQYADHLDWHFRQNRMGKDLAKRATCRKWYYETQDWIQYEEFEDLEARRSAFFEQQIEEAQAGFSGTTSDQNNIPASGTGYDYCNICHEQFEQYWDEEDEDWKLRNAIKVNEKTYHPGCYDDELKKNAQMDTSGLEEHAPEDQTDDLPKEEVWKSTSKYHLPSQATPDLIPAIDVKEEPFVEPVKKDATLEHIKAEPLDIDEIPFKTEPDEIPIKTESATDDRTAVDDAMEMSTVPDELATSDQIESFATVPDELATSDHIESFATLPNEQATSDQIESVPTDADGLATSGQTESVVELMQTDSTVVVIDRSIADNLSVKEFGPSINQLVESAGDFAMETEESQTQGQTETLCSSDPNSNEIKTRETFSDEQVLVSSNNAVDSSLSVNDSEDVTMETTSLPNQELANLADNDSDIKMETLNSSSQPQDRLFVQDVKMETYDSQNQHVADSTVDDTSPQTHSAGGSSVICEVSHDDNDVDNLLKDKVLDNDALKYDLVDLESSLVSHTAMTVDAESDFKSSEPMIDNNCTTVCKEVSENARTTVTDTVTGASEIPDCIKTEIVTESVNKGTMKRNATSLSDDVNITEEADDVYIDVVGTDDPSPVESNTADTVIIESDSGCNVIPKTELSEVPLKEDTRA